MLKFGQYSAEQNHVRRLASDERPDPVGLVAGAELQLYLFRWLGLEANFNKFGKGSSLSNKAQPSGTAFDYAAYIEIALSRILVGQYQEDWTYPLKDGSATWKARDAGRFAGLKIQF